MFCFENRFAPLVDVELARSVHWSEFEGVGNLFLQFRQLLLRRKPFTTSEILYFKSIAFALWFLLYSFWRRMYEEYKNEDARYALQYVKPFASMLKNLEFCSA